MKTIAEKLYQLTDELPMRWVDDDNGVRYLERYYLTTLFGFRVYIHCFLNPDPDRGLHDHPWAFAVAVRLSGYYYEQTRAWRRRQRLVRFLTGDTFHRITSLSGREVWTLFAHTADDVKPWGFWREGDQLTNPPKPTGAALFIPYEYKREGGKPFKWWETAKTRKQWREGSV